MTAAQFATAYFVLSYGFLLPPLLTVYLAILRGRNPWIWGVIAFLCSPFALLVYFLPRKEGTVEDPAIMRHVLTIEAVLGLLWVAALLMPSLARS